MQQLTEIQIGYIAGLIDGEGYIGLSKSPNKFSPRLGIGMTDYDVLVWLKDLVGGNLSRKHRSFITDAPCWQYSMTASVLREVLPVIAPYLKVKQRQAYLMLTYFSYFKKDDRNAMKGLKAVVKNQFHKLFKTMNSRGNRKRGEFRENLSEATLSQALEEIQGKVQRLESDVKDIRRAKIVGSLKKYGKIAPLNLAKCHYNDVEKNKKEFFGIMAELEKEGVTKRTYSKFSKTGYSYIYTGNDSTRAPGESHDIVRTDRRLSEVEDKELSR